MKKLKLIAIDNGKRNVKARCGNEELVFRNYYSEEHSAIIGEESKTWNVTYDDKEYTIGDSATKPVDTMEGKGSEIHKVSTLTTITRFLKEEDEGKDIILIYGESLSFYKNRENMANIKNAFTGVHELVVDGKKYCFRIKEVVILPEGIGVAMENFANFKGIQYIVDIGGKTINFLCLNEGRPVLEESFSEGMGIMNIETNLSEKFKNNPNIGELSAAIISEKLRTGTDNPEMQRLINKAIIDQFKKFDDELAKKNVYIHNIIKQHGMTFVGGGSELFANQIYDHYSNKVRIAPDALRTNVRGFYTYGMAKFDLEE